MDQNVQSSNFNPIPMSPLAMDTLIPFQSRRILNQNTGGTSRNGVPSSSNNTSTVDVGSSASLANNAPTSSNVYNLTNANDVVIGPMTQYRGPVTIYQHLDANFDSSRIGGGPNVALRNTSQNQNETSLAFGSQRIPNWLILLASVIIAVGLGFGVFLALKNNNTEIRDNRTPREILFGNEHENGPLIYLGNGTNVIPREQWGGLDVNNTTKFKLHHPIPYVMITHIGVQSVPCETVYDCSVQMRTIQDAAVAEKKIKDLPANFYAGNDGYIYAGRGWNQTNSYNNVSLAICMIGDFIRYDPHEKQLNAVKLLINYGTKHKLIADDYKLVAHNQTKKTGSPGVKVYREIIKWPHWSPCIYTDVNNICGAELGIAATNWKGKS